MKSNFKVNMVPSNARCHKRSTVQTLTLQLLKTGLLVRATANSKSPWCCAWEWEELTPNYRQSGSLLVDQSVWDHDCLANVYFDSVSNFKSIAQQKPCALHFGLQPCSNVCFHHFNGTGYNSTPHIQPSRNRAECGTKKSRIIRGVRKSLFKIKIEQH